MTDLSARASTPASSPSRRLVAAGIIRRFAGRTLTVRATQSGVTGAITPTRADRIAELHRLCREDYESNASRRIQGRRDDANLIANAVEAVTCR
ncbi:hypothetical protein ACSCBZ_42545 [Streptomyces niveiscabiei]|uniref:hypothetical protein n=1 Tax=Streptomyces niveiscabiei TaxID=164115 RepID=UPI0006EB5CB9|nr:hypothetical protein [Streptomyces niveiscabiei]